MTLPLMEQLMLMVDVPFETGVPSGDHDVAFALVKKAHPSYTDEQIEQCVKYRKVKAKPRDSLMTIFKDGNEDIVDDFLGAEDDLAQQVAKHSKKMNFKLISSAQNELPALDPDAKHADGKTPVEWPDYAMKNYELAEARLLLPRSKGCTISIHTEGR